MSSSPDEPMFADYASGDDDGDDDGGVDMAPEPAAASGAPARRGRSSGSGGPSRRAGTRPPRSRSTPKPQREPASEDTGGSSLAGALRELLSGIDEEVAAISALSSDIDEHVIALNDLRAEATRRLLHLDDLRSTADDVNLSAFLDTSIQPQLPQVGEDFPDRIYGG